MEEGSSVTSMDNLPLGWSVVTYSGPGNQDLYAVYVGPRREVAGLPSVESARRWVRLLSRHYPSSDLRDRPLPWPELSAALA